MTLTDEDCEMLAFVTVCGLMVVCFLLRRTTPMGTRLRGLVVAGATSLLTATGMALAADWSGPCCVCIPTNPYTAHVAFAGFALVIAAITAKAYDTLPVPDPVPRCRALRRRGGGG